MSYLIFDFGTGGAGAVQYVRPASEVAKNGWKGHDPFFGGDADLAAMIDESSSEDADYDYSSWAPVNDTMEVLLVAPTTDPDVNSGHIVSYRIGGEGTPASLTVSLYCGATLIKSWAHSNVSTLTTHNQTLDDADAANITDYADLRLRFVANQA